MQFATKFGSNDDIEKEPLLGKADPSTGDQADVKGTPST